AGGAGTGGQIQDALARLRVDRAGDGTPPARRLPSGKDLIGEVVTPGHLIEHGGDLAGLLVQLGTVHALHDPSAGLVALIPATPNALGLPRSPIGASGAAAPALSARPASPGPHCPACAARCRGFVDWRCERH